MQPASKPAAPRLHKTVASTRLCQGRSAGKGLARGGEGRLFSRPCNFPRSRLADPTGVGRGRGPSQGRHAIPEHRGGEWGGAGPTQLYFLFSFFTPLSFSLPLPLRSWERSGEGSEGRGGDRRHPGSPGLLGSGSSTPGYQRTGRWIRLAGRGGVGSERQLWPQFPLLCPFRWRLAILTSAFKCKVGRSLRIFFIHCY